MFSMLIPRNPRVTLPLSRSWGRTLFNVLIGTAKPMFCAGRNIAVLIPMTSPLTLMSGPPEFPELMAASVWMKFSNERVAASPVRPYRPFAETTPTVTLLSKFKGSPIAMTHSPTRSRSESPRASGVRRCLTSILRSARSVAGSRPTMRAIVRSRLFNRTSTLSALSMTW